MHQSRPIDLDTEYDRSPMARVQQPDCHCPLLVNRSSPETPNPFPFTVTNLSLFSVIVFPPALSHRQRNHGGHERCALDRISASPLNYGSTMDAIGITILRTSIASHYVTNPRPEPPPPLPPTRRDAHYTPTHLVGLEPGRSHAFFRSSSSSRSLSFWTPQVLMVSLWGPPRPRFAMQSAPHSNDAPRQKGPRSPAT